MMAAAHALATDPAAEQAVLTTCLHDDAAIATVADLLSAEDFASTENGLIYEAMLHLHRGGAPLDTVTLRRQLVADGQLAKVGGDARLDELNNTIPTFANVEAHAKILRERRILRDLEHRLHRLLGRCRSDASADASVLLGEAEREIADLVRAQGAAYDPLRDRWRTLGERGNWLDVEPPPQRWLLRRDGHPVLARAIVAMLIAPGGRGKTWALTQLALSVATGRPWLETFEVVEPGRVVLALAEENETEVRRRLYYAAQAMNLSESERRLAETRIVPLGLHGVPVSLVRAETDGSAVPTRLHAQLLRQIESAEHAAVILDPLSRWATVGESSNAAATTSVTALERLAKAPGEPCVLVAHHTSKWSRREGNKGDASGARGVTGLTDAARFVAALEGSKEDDLALAVVKANGAPPCQPLPLVRAAEGVLRPPNSTELDQRVVAAASRREEIRRAIVAAVVANPGIGTTALRTACKPVRATEVDAEAAKLVTAGVIANRPSGKANHYHLVGEVPS